MAPTETTRQPASPPEPRDTAALHRVIVYVVAAVVVCVVAWALIEGGERDLWTRSSAAPALVFAPASAW